MYYVCEHCRYARGKGLKGVKGGKEWILSRYPCPLRSRFWWTTGVKFWRTVRGTLKRKGEGEYRKIGDWMRLGIGWRTRRRWRKRKHPSNPHCYRWRLRQLLRIFDVGFNVLRPCRRCPRKYPYETIGIYW